MSTKWTVQTPNNPDVNPEQAKALDFICRHLDSTGDLHPAEYDADTDHPMKVSVSPDGEWAGAEGALFTWHDAKGSFWRGWIRADGQVGRVEQDVIDKPSDDPCEIESHWERRAAMMVDLRRATGVTARPFM